MKPPIFVRSLSEEEREALKAGLRSKDAFVMRRSQMLLASSRGQSPPEIARGLGCGSQTVRNAIHAFNERGLDPLTPGSSRPKRIHTAFDEESAEALREMLHRSPREFGYDTSLWTLQMAAEVAFKEELTQERVSGETIRATLSRLLGVRWMRAKRWITSPDPLYEKKAARSADGGGPGQPRNLGGGLLGRVLVEPGGPLPTLSSWSEQGKPLRLIQQSAAKDDPEPKALSCYGLYAPELDQTWLRFVDGRPVSTITTQFLEWSLEKLEAAAKKVVVLIWDNASWHISREVRRWLGSHNREVKESGRGVRIVSRLLPKQRVCG